MKGVIIFLNGASSSGKAAIARALQALLPEPYLYLSVDSIVHMLPDQFMATETEALSEAQEELLSQLIPQVVSAVHQSAAVFAANGINLILDHVIQKREWMEECVELLHNFPVLFVGVVCDPVELERRERESNRMVGLASLQLDVVHAHGIYDLKVDTCALTSHECAETIRQALLRMPTEGAFQRMKALLAQGALWVES